MSASKGVLAILLGVMVMATLSCTLLDRPKLADGEPTALLVDHLRTRGESACASAVARGEWFKSYEEWLETYKGWFDPSDVDASGMPNTLTDRSLPAMVAKYKAGDPEHFMDKVKLERQHLVVGLEGYAAGVRTWNPAGAKFQEVYDGNGAWVVTSSLLRPRDHYRKISMSTIYLKWTVHSPSRKIWNELEKAAETYASTGSYPSDFHVLYDQLYYQDQGDTIDFDHVLTYENENPQDNLSWRVFEETHKVVPENAPHAC